MSAAPTKFAPVRRQLDAYKESWMKDHEAAMQCQHTEEILAIGITLFDLLQRIEHGWRERVFRGEEEYNDHDNAVLLGFYRDWLTSTDSTLGSLAELERDFGKIEGAAECQDRAERVRQLLATWQPPSLSSAVGLREMQLDDQAAAELQALIDRAGGPETPPTRPLRRLPTADPSFLKKPTP
jgi:hypothetical protein